ncbi:MAG TPA: N-(5'-phosphoribosyl)anthranilate isomerase [Halobacteria archaeon]|nr:N-(5'-phosphoribosyl)anthranilate isomerase [Halobacteria archaeon]
MKIVLKFRNYVTAFGMIVGNTISKRRISFDKARELIEESNIPSVAVTSDKSYDDLKRIIGLGTDGIQLHSDISYDLVDKIKKEYSGFIFKVFEIEKTIKNPFDEANKILSRMPLYDADGFLLDTSGGGGTGITHDLRVSKLVLNNAIKPVVIAGGINHSNVDEFIKLDPFGIDVSSGVETDGIKDEKKIKYLLDRVGDFYEC